jgi:30S ribosomal protein S31
MGAGDKRTRKGKIFKGSYGNSRPHSPARKKAAAAAPVRAPAAKSAGKRRGK